MYTFNLQRDPNMHFHSVGGTESDTTSTTNMYRFHVPIRGHVDVHFDRFKRLARFLAQPSQRRLNVHQVSFQDQCFERVPFRLTAMHHPGTFFTHHRHHSFRQRDVVANLGFRFGKGVGGGRRRRRRRRGGGVGGIGPTRSTRRETWVGASSINHCVPGRVRGECSIGGIGGIGGIGVSFVSFVPALRRHARRQTAGHAAFVAGRLRHPKSTL